MEGWLDGKVTYGGRDGWVVRKPMEEGIAM